MQHPPAVFLLDSNGSKEIQHSRVLADWSLQGELDCRMVLPQRLQQAGQIIARMLAGAQEHWNDCHPPGAGRSQLRRGCSEVGLLQLEIRAADCQPRMPLL